jgi:hypothetical protein
VAKTPIEFILQHTDYKSVGVYRKFSSDNASNPIMGARASAPLLRALGWATAVIMTAAGIGMLVTL